MSNTGVAPRSASLALLAVVTATGQQSTQGTLRIRDRQGRPQAECPLQHTSVSGDIAGMVARVRVVQDFRNALSETIEAVYTFPLPHGDRARGSRRGGIRGPEG
jgi:hypothetical protein